MGTVSSEAFSYVRDALPNKGLTEHKGRTSNTEREMGRDRGVGGLKEKTNTCWYNSKRNNISIQTKNIIDIQRFNY